MTAGYFKDLTEALRLDVSSDTEPFHRADTNGDGKLELQEVKQAVNGYANEDSSDCGARTRLLNFTVQLAALAAVLSHV